MSTIRAYLRLIIFLIHLIFRVGLLAIVLPFAKNQDKTMFRMRRKWGKEACRILGIKRIIHGTPRSDLALYVSNHRSIIDPVILFSEFDVYPLSKEEIVANPILALGAKKIGALLVKRSENSSRKKALKEIAEYIRGGKPVLLFPEGTTSNEKHTLPFKRGSLYLAVEENIPVIPITLVYPSSDYHWFEEGMFSHFMKQIKNRRSIVHIFIGEPEMYSDAILAAEELRNWMHSCIDAAHEEKLVSV